MNKSVEQLKITTKMKMNKVMAVVTIMTLTSVIPAMAGNKKNNNRNNDKVVIVVNENKAPAHTDKRTSHFAPKPVALRPDVKVCTFRVNSRSAHGNIVARAERIHGVMDAYYNPRTHEVTVRYDAHMTSAHHIMHSVA